jgi:hypothetical protein
MENVKTNISCNTWRPSAAFLAAKSEAPVTMPLMLDAARNEFRKLDKPINEIEFRVMEAVRSTL